jgi:SGNH hydrolase-like domain, acetyltransferase AlgX
VSVAALSALYVVLLWLVSSMLRGKGILLVAAGAAALAAALVAASRGRRQPLYRLFFLTALAAAGTLGGEGILWLAPGLLKGRLANQVLGGYHSEPDGIYVPDPYLGRTLRPGFARSMYWNGHVWRHEANADGYRGPRFDRADAVFLGDSMIYGHGVETAQTVPARFQAVSGLSSANLGQQGTGPVQALELLRRKGLRLRPRYVFLCAHPTDVMDGPAAYDPAELARFVETDGYRPLARAGDESRIFQYWLFHVAIPLRAARVLRGVLHPAEPGLGPAVAANDDAHFVPSPEYVAEPFAPLAPGADAGTKLGWSALRRAIVEIAHESQRIGARLVVFDIGYPTAFSAAIEGVAGEVGARYSDVGRTVLARARRGEDVYLRRDGHWSPAGADAVARGLYADLGQNGGTTPLQGVKE